MAAELRVLVRNRDGSEEEVPLDPVILHGRPLFLLPDYPHYSEVRCPACSRWIKVNGFQVHRGSERCNMNLLRDSLLEAGWAELPDACPQMPEWVKKCNLQTRRCMVERPNVNSQGAVVGYGTVYVNGWFVPAWAKDMRDAVDQAWQDKSEAVRRLVITTMVGAPKQLCDAAVAAVRIGASPGEVTRMLKNGRKQR